MIWFYLKTFHARKNFPNVFCAILIIVLAIAWTGINYFHSPFLNLAALAATFFMLSFLFCSSMMARLFGMIIYIGVGILVEPIGFFFLQMFSYEPVIGFSYRYYFVVALSELLRLNLIFLLCKVGSLGKIRLMELPKGILMAVAVVFLLAIMNCCFVVLLSLEAGSLKSLIIGISVLVSIMLTYYIILYMIERFTYLMNQRHEEELYRKEMQSQELYYKEMEKRNESIQNLKHDLKNKLAELYSFLEKKEIGQIERRMLQLCEELENVDSCRYCSHPIVDSVFRVKMGTAKVEGIPIECSILIPKKMKLAYGDIGVLYGNLLDNAIEACRKVETEKRFLSIENKYRDGKLLLVIENSKNEKELYQDFHTTKEDKESHGRGIANVRKVVEKYHGTLKLSDGGDRFEAAVMLYGIEAEQRKSDNINSVK